MQTEKRVTYREYVEQIKNEVEKRTGNHVILQKITKNNGLVLDGMTILVDGTNVAPTIYLNEFYGEFITRGADAVTNKIISIYEDNKIEGTIDTSFFTDIDKVKHNIKMKLANYEKNKELLEDTPHVKFLDLAIMFTVLLDSGQGDGIASILIHNHHLDLWGMNTETLHSIAMENTTYDYEIIPMSEVIDAITGEIPEPELMKNAVIDMGILTNHSNLHGATGMLHRDILDHYMQKDHTKELIILPSSIHEVILVSGDLLTDMDRYREMVKNVNASHVEPSEVLSNSVYVYDGNSITIA